MAVVFSSDASFQNTGFRAHYFTIPPGKTNAVKLPQMSNQREYRQAIPRANVCILYLWVWTEGKNIPDKKSKIPFLFSPVPIITISTLMFCAHVCFANYANKHGGTHVKFDASDLMTYAQLYLETMRYL